MPKKEKGIDFFEKKFEFFVLSKETEKDWDDFVISNQRGSIHQISAFKVLQEKITGRGPVYGFGVRQKKHAKYSKILAAVLCVKMQTGIFGKYWWYSSRGPVFSDGNIEAVQYLLQKSREILVNPPKKILNSYQKKDFSKGIFWRLDPYVKKNIFHNFFTKNYLRQATQNYQPTDTLELDLTKTEDVLLSEMKRKGRYNINLSNKKGVKFREISAENITTEDLKDFWRLNQETTGRDGFSGHDKEYYQHFLQKLQPHAVLFFAEKDKTRIATAITTFCGTKAIYYFGASTSDKKYRNLMAPYGLQWTMIKAAKKRDCQTYDFLGISPKGEPNHVYAGISNFKWKFGGERQTYQKGVEIVFDKFWYKIYSWGKKMKNFCRKIRPKKAI